MDFVLSGCQCQLSVLSRLNGNGEFGLGLLLRFFALAAVSVGVRKLSQSRENLGLFGKKTRSTGIGGSVGFQFYSFLRQRLNFRGCRLRFSQTLF